MEFVMLMNGPSASDLDIVGGVVNVNSFVFAHGQENTFGYHQGRGTFALDLQTLSPTKGPTTPIPTRKPSTSPTTAGHWARDAQAYDFINNGQASDAQAKKEVR